MIPSKTLDFKTLAIDNKYGLCYRSGVLYKWIKATDQFERIGSLPSTHKESFLTKFRLTERLFRLDPRVALQVDEDFFLLSFRGSLYNVNAKERTITKELSFRRGMNNPLSLVSIKNLNGFDDCVVFGEYFSNNDFEEVNVWRRSKNEWEIAYSFPLESIYHIHGLVPDYLNDCIYILTGDNDNESAIWKATENFSKVEPILIGSQQYRSCVAFPFEGGLLYATDTPRQQNYIYKAYKSNNQWQVVPIAEIPGPCIYGTQLNGAYYFATSVEGDDTLSPFRYRYSYKLGKGVKDRYSHIMKIDGNGTSSEVIKLKKDIWPMLLFQFGNCLFPSQNDCRQLVVCPQSVRKYDNKTIIL